VQKALKNPRIVAIGVQAPAANEMVVVCCAPRQRWRPIVPDTITRTIAFLVAMRARKLPERVHARIGPHRASESPVTSEIRRDDLAGMPDTPHTMADSLTDLDRAAAVVYAAMAPTPQQRWPLLDERCGAAVWIKHENHTPVGAFKVRGGLVYFDHLRSAGAGVSGVVAATRGNHGQSVAFAAKRSGLPVTVVVPHGNSVSKNRAMRALGAELIERGHDFQASLEAAAQIAAERGWHSMPSFHPLLVRGVATYALELLRAVPDLDTLYVPIGLGSGICGTIAARDALGLRTRIVGVVAAAAPAYARSLEAGRLVSHDAATRIADGVACRTPVPEALDIIRAGIDRLVEVTDDEIERAMQAIFDDTHNVAEGAAATGLAALLRERDRVQGRTVGFILTGANVDRDLFASVLQSSRSPR
jgi:threonine dehydratase